MIVPVVIKQCIASLMDAKVWVTICVLGMVAGQRVKEDMVDMLVGQLAKEVEAENAEMAVSELVEIFRKVKNGRKSLTEEIWRMLKKLKGKSRKVVLPAGVIHLLKARMRVKGKQGILEKVLNVIQAKYAEDNSDRTSLQVIWASPLVKSIPAVKDAEAVQESSNSKAVLSLDRDEVSTPTTTYFVQNITQYEQFESNKSMFIMLHWFPALILMNSNKFFVAQKLSEWQNFKDCPLCTAY